LQNLLEAHVTHHETANLLKYPKLLFKPLQAGFELFSLRHGFIIVEVRKAALQDTELWLRTELPLRIEYSLAAMEEIRRRAETGLITLPRVGLGTGGALIGERRGVSLEIQSAVEIPCSHAHGPSFRLSVEERAAAKALLPPFGVLGGYCSKPKGTLELNPSDIELFDQLFPGPWKLFLVAQVSLSEGMRGALFFRDGADRVQKAGSQVIETRAARKPIKQNPIGIAPHLPPLRIPPIPEAAEPVSVSVPAPQEGPSEPPQAQSFAFNSLFYEPEPAPEPAWKSKIGWVIVALLLIAVAAGAWVTKDFWLPRPSLTLTSAPVSTNGGASLEVKWNPESVRGLDRASIFINDGGSLKEVPIDKRQLESGQFLYQLQSEHVTAIMHAGDLRAITQYFRPETPTK